MEIVYVRHAEALCNIRDDAAHDAELTDLGKEQIKLVAKRLSNEKFDRIFCSPLVRTLETATAIAGYNSNPIYVHTHIREFHSAQSSICASGEELKKRFTKATFEEEVFNSDKGWKHIGGETKESLQERAQEVIDFIHNNIGENEKILIVSHAGFGTAFISALLGLKPGVVRFEQHNTCINRFLINPDGLRIVCINDYSHLK